MNLVIIAVAHDLGNQNGIEGKNRGALFTYSNFLYY